MQKPNKFISIFSGLLILGVSGVLTFYMHVGANKLPVRQYFPGDKTVAVWDWKNPTTRQSDELKSMSDYFYMHQINTAFVDISGYADISKRNDQKQAKQLEDSLAKYVKALSKHHVKVFASAGDTDWSKRDQQHIPLAIQQFVYSYNKHHKDAKLSGLEFDIESYNQDGFPGASMDEKSIVLTEMLDMVDSLAAKQQTYSKQTHDSQFELGFAIPYWFDNENGNIPSITWHGKTGPMLYHLADRLNSLPKANLNVMAYRNAAIGNDGVIFHTRTEVEYTSAKARHVRVLVGQEVNDVEPAKITYFNKTLSEFSGEVQLINDEMKKYPTYGGIAINDLKGLQAMQE